ncbi:MAG: carboxypeptidase-like regulatory domain-containing protein [Ferruginibacter sp.]
MKYIPLSFFILFFNFLHAQPLQTIRGTVTDYASNTPVAGATIQVVNISPRMSAVADSAGNFSFQLPVGRYNLEASGTGYFPVLVRDILVSSAKETFVTLTMQQRITLLTGVTVSPRVAKEQPINNMATVSARMLSVEEAKKYAGGFDDPARLAASFAGVTGNIDQNGIIVRGNAPKFMQWKMEGVEIPNPNHFGDLETVGSGILTAMSSQVLANSDFLTGAFPSEYSNALSGVFDMSMRKGNNQKYEHTFQVGVLGIDASSEGPFRKGGKSSYLFNYRYSTLALVAPLLPENGNTIKYQDLSFKLNFPTKKAGTFTLWGMGLRDGAGSTPKTDKTKWIYEEDNEENDVRLSSGSAGLAHKYFLNRKTYIKTTLAGSGNQTLWVVDKFNNTLESKPLYRGEFKELSLTFSSFINNKINAGHTNKTGIVATKMFYDIFLNKSFVLGTPPAEIVNEKGSSALLSGFSSSAINLTSRLTMNAGINAQYFLLNQHYTVEPRLGFRQQIGAGRTIGIAYGLHSRIEKLNYYLNNDIITGKKEINKDLDFTKAHHLVMSFDCSITSNLHLKIEPYYQAIYDAPVIADSSFSFLNLQGDWFFSSQLQSTGKGRNYGVELTIEKYISKGFYYLVTGSVFKSEYRGGDNVWRNTRFNRSYALNVLGGKEWKMGHKRQNILSLNARFTQQGGYRFSPVNTAASVAAKDVVYDETSAYSLQAPGSLNMHFTASYKINRKKTAHEFAIKLLNVTNQPDFKGHRYNLQQNKVEVYDANVAIPNISYKLEF